MYTIGLETSPSLRCKLVTEIFINYIKENVFSGNVFKNCVLRSCKNVNGVKKIRVDWYQNHCNTILHCNVMELKEILVFLKIKTLNFLSIYRITLKNISSATF